jgi:hypothetical protein
MTVVDSSFTVLSIEACVNDESTTVIHHLIDSDFQWQHASIESTANDESTTVIHHLIDSDFQWQHASIESTVNDESRTHLEELQVYFYFIIIYFANKNSFLILSSA